MSALGQKQTFAVQTGMSALPPKADIGRRLPTFCLLTVGLRQSRRLAARLILRDYWSNEKLPVR